MSSTAATVGVDPKLASLREEMAKAGGLSALIVPSEDPHLLEYPPSHQQRRAFISGFTGSAGTAVITTDKAALWTDGRYFLQASEEMGPDWTLMKVGTKDCPQITEWLREELSKGDKVGLDPSCSSEATVNSWKMSLEGKGIEISPTEGNLVDLVWTDRPPAAASPVRLHEKYSGESVKLKLERLRKEMDKLEAGAMFVGKLDEIAWILNLRGADEPFTPIFISYLLIEKEAATLFIDKQKVPPQVSEFLQQSNISVEDYENAAEGVMKTVRSGTNIWMDADQVNSSFFNAARMAADGDKTNGAKAGFVIGKETPITDYMAVKNETEMAGMQEAHLRDGVAVSQFLSWFEKEIASGKSFSEVQVDEELTARRAKQDGFVSCSFPTIAGANANGAVIHYRAEEETCKMVDGNTMMLIDSGGQYDCGTTDITRTFHLGTPTAHQKMCFTRVLQGHIGLAQATFPENTPGIAIDALARVPLWAAGLNYNHGTGHGVGSHLCVHEGPISISHRYHTKMGQQPLRENMIVSNEPGYYEDGNFGCRIENLVRIKEADTPFHFGDVKYLTFENITFVPFQKKMMDLDIMTVLEKKWVNEYHSQVWEKISPRIKDEDTLQWLKENTEPIPV